ncbi:MAG: hypothetical protein R3C25_10820 [Hyphomonadaceae bacterium]
MRSLLCSAAALSLALAAPTAVAQSADEMLLQMETVMADAEAAAVHPGDEDLSCEALQADMNAQLQDPAVQAQMAATGAWAEGQNEAANAARARAMGQVGLSMFLGLAGSFIPGAGYAQEAAQRAIAAGQQAQAEQNMAQAMQQAQGTMAIMPQLMRGQRVYELGQAKQCAFAQEGAQQ